jgi:hypothetical protein
MLDAEFNPFDVPNAAATSNLAARRVVPQRSLIGELIGTSASMLAGAVIGLMVGGNGVGFVSFVILCSLFGWVMWTRRKRSIAGTIGICILMLIVWWPIGLILREVGRELY